MSITVLLRVKCSDGENLSAKTARYTDEFCRTWLQCLGKPFHLCRFACLLEDEMCSAASEPEREPVDILAAEDESFSDGQVLTTARNCATT